ncbi:hypothetical protein SESBI_35279 [Sesbania bispinosa]|nr:hypothetical protein SESBI_35279 [Sesbania bispinosa]
MCTYGGWADEGAADILRQAVIDAMSFERFNEHSPASTNSAARSFSHTRRSFCLLQHKEDHERRWHNA